MIEVAKVATARRISKRLIQGKLKDGFTARDLQRKQWSGATTVNDAEGALAILEEHNHVRSFEDTPPSGRPTVRYYINPRLLDASK